MEFSRKAEFDADALDAAPLDRIDESESGAEETVVLESDSSLGSRLITDSSSVPIVPQLN